MNLLQLFRLRRWAQHPPSWRRVKLILAVVAICFGIWGIDQADLWPDWAKTERVKRNHIHISPVSQ
ncbi:MAG: hypothetical protein CML66_30425 [Rhodobacteraceae bacterium]|nr:hypothetical protein [Paracoccaceae bacterium]|tara:strand:+ start:145 stop:342 length:198 start_codon:yes stop_codon:yes gene_type:complete